VIESQDKAITRFRYEFATAAVAVDWPQCLINAVVSMGRSNTGPKSNLQVFQRLKSFESADSKKTLPCLGLTEYSSKEQVSLKNAIGSTD
jgi:hypothetical protein